MNAPLQLAEIGRVAQWLRDMCGDDEELFADMSEAENWPAERFIARVYEQIARDGEMLAGIKERQAAIAERKQRIEHRYEQGKRAIGMALRAAQLAKLELPEATFSVRDGKPRLVVTDPEAVPSDYQRIKTEPDKTAINEAFEGKVALPNWLVREAATDVVTVRTK